VISLGADHDVDHWRAALRFAAFRLGDASGKCDQRLGAVLSFESADIRISLFRCLCANVAGVEHDEIGLDAVCDGGHALLEQQFGHPLAVVNVHLAAEAFDFESLGSHSLRPIGEWS